MNRMLIMLLAVCALHTVVVAQHLNTWKGGHPGRETDWTCAENWSLGRVPDWTHDIVVPNVSTYTGHYPVLRNGTFEAASLVVRPYASLTLTDGAVLVVAGANPYRTGLWNDGRVILLGKLEFEAAPQRTAGNYGGNGAVENGARSAGL